MRRIEMSKGSKPRPISIPKKQFDEQFEAIFGKRKKNGKKK